MLRFFYLYNVIKITLCILCFSLIIIIFFTGEILFLKYKKNDRQNAVFSNFMNKSILYDEGNQMMMIDHSIPARLYNNGKLVVKYHSVYQQKKYNSYYIPKADLIDDKIKIAYKEQFIEYQQRVKFVTLKVVFLEEIILIDENGYYQLIDGTYICPPKEEDRIQGLFGKCHEDSYIHE